VSKNNDKAWILLKSHVLQLDTRFRVFKQGDLSVSDYCRRMKGMTDDLRALGETVTSFLTFYMD
jgi:hypothetical protein